MIDNLDFARLRAIGLAPALFSTLANLPDTATPQRLMRVTEGQRDSVSGHDGDAEHRARLRPALHAALADAGLPGDALDEVDARVDFSGSAASACRSPGAAVDEVDVVAVLLRCQGGGCGVRCHVGLVDGEERVGGRRGRS